MVVELLSYGVVVEVGWKQDAGGVLCRGSAGGGLSCAVWSVESKLARLVLLYTREEKNGQQREQVVLVWEVKAEGGDEEFICRRATESERDLVNSWRCS